MDDSLADMAARKITGLLVAGNLNWYLTFGGDPDEYCDAASSILYLQGEMGSVPLTTGFDTKFVSQIPAGVQPPLVNLLEATRKGPTALYAVWNEMLLQLTPKINVRPQESERAISKTLMSIPADRFSASYFPLKGIRVFIQGIPCPLFSDEDDIIDLSMLLPASALQELDDFVSQPPRKRPPPLL